MTVADPMPCQELVELVTDYLEDALTQRDRERFDVHVAGCSACTRYFHQIRTTIRVLGTLRQQAPPA